MTSPASFDFRLSWWRPRWSGWQCLVGVSYEGHPREASLTIDLLFWRVLLEWDRSL